MNSPIAILHFNNSSEGNPRILKPDISGLWFSNKILHKYLFEDSNPEKIVNEAVTYSNSLNNTYDRLEFSETIIPALLVIDRIDCIPNFTELSNTLSAPNHQAAMQFLFTKAYRLLHTNVPLNSTDNSTIEQAYGLLNPLKNYIGIIIGETLRSVYFLQNNSLDETYGCIRNAIELSSVAHYKLVEIFLMKNLANTLKQLGENQRASECSNYVKSMWKLSGYKKEII
jgi:hypothetical protein